MALPQSAIEQLSRKVPKSPAWFGELLMFAATIFFLTLIVYLGLRFGYKPYLERQVRQLNDKIAAFSQEIPENEQQKIVAFYSQLNNLKTLLGKHVFVSPVFTLLEENTLPTVYFSKAGFSLQTNQLTLSGVARDAGDVAVQVKRFETLPIVSDVNLKSMSGSVNNRVQFEIALTLDPALVQALPTQQIPQ